MNRSAVLMLMYDLPVATREQKRIYTQFRKELIRSGFQQFQESVYVKLLRNTSSSEHETRRISRLAPKEGTVSILSMSLAVFKSMKTVSGTGFDMQLFADDILYF